MIYSNRRDFLKASALGLGGILLPNILKSATVKDVGIQLYTLRNEIKKDLTGTLKTVASLGYKYVEGYYVDKGHFFGMKPKEFKSMLSDMGLIMNSNHVLSGRSQPEVKSSMANNWEKIVDDLLEAGVKYVVCPWIPEVERNTINDYKKLADYLNQKGQYSKHKGIQLCYHAHDFELKPLKGQIPYDLLLSETDRAFVQFEMDLYWVKKAGKEPQDYFEKYPGRFPLWHVKDMDKTDKQHYTEVGQGTIDFKKIFAESEKAGMKYFYVEQDECANHPLKSAQISYNYLKGMEY
ncbi:MAG TPA: sugar phosphate isomerase/epimerase [Cytophagaceae bacterium]|jgi:sugar phosphate isomerase/epimerase